MYLQVLFTSANQTSKRQTRHLGSGACTISAALSSLWFEHCAVHPTGALRLKALPGAAGTHLNAALHLPSPQFLTGYMKYLQLGFRVQEVEVAQALTLTLVQCLSTGSLYSGHFVTWECFNFAA